MSLKDSQFDTWLFYKETGQRPEIQLMKKRNELPLPTTKDILFHCYYAEVVLLCYAGVFTTIPFSFCSNDSTTFLPCKALSFVSCHVFTLVQDQTKIFKLLHCFHYLYIHSDHTLLLALSSYCTCFFSPLDNLYSGAVGSLKASPWVWAIGEWSGSFSVPYMAVRVMCEV